MMIGPIYSATLCVLEVIGGDRNNNSVVYQLLLLKNITHINIFFYHTIYLLNHISNIIILRHPLFHNVGTFKFSYILPTNKHTLSLFNPQHPPQSHFPHNYKKSPLSPKSRHTYSRTRYQFIFSYWYAQIGLLVLLIQD